MRILQWAARRAQPPRHFLMRAGHSCCCDVVTGIILGSYSCYYAIVRGRGKRMRGEESWAWWKGESIVSVATMEANERETRLKHTRWRKQCSLFLLSSKRMTMRMKTKSKWLVFYTWPFEGRLNPKIALRPFPPSLFLLVAHGLDKWITNVWARTMLLA